MDKRLNRLERDYGEGRINRREFIRRATYLTGSFAFAMNFLSACAPPAPASPTAGSDTAAAPAKSAAGGKPKKD